MLYVTRFVPRILTGLGKLTRGPHKYNDLTKGPRDTIFDKASLINSALMAKIHTVEWTPAILAHPALQIGMTANYGIPGSGVNHFGVPYSLTEDFTTSPSLMPPTASTNQLALRRYGLQQGPESVPLRSLLRRIAFYSFGISYPGAITNNNYPNFMRNLSTPDGQFRDMGTVDILRDRERGVPRYNQFRRLLCMSAPKTFGELTGGNKELAQELCQVYGDIELVDTLVGSHSEPLPKGFGFSDTAFQIFILMASRRLKSDRFLAGQWNSDTYTKEGLPWLQNIGMKGMLVRHFPELEMTLKKTENVFAPWEKKPESMRYEGAETNAPGL
ncbi:hypothetical protein AnigIFM63326_001631 [Aspergillus niger]|nr:hypothetical protein AnigIFM63326_001631 [Aspergillus niger]